MKIDGSTENSRLFPGNISLLLDACRDASPDQEGIGTPDRMLIFAQYHDRVCRLAQGLRTAGLEQTDRVLVSSLDPLGYAVVSLAVFRLGAVLVPVNPRMGPYELALQLQCSGFGVQYFHFSRCNAASVEPSVTPVHVGTPLLKYEGYGT